MRYYAQRLLVRLIYWLEFFFGWISADYRRIRFLPVLRPLEVQLNQWRTSCYPDYQKWIDKNESWTLRAWIRQYLQARRNYQKFCKISIVTPVYNPDAEHFRECIASVQLQSHPFWEWILVDDGSDDPEVLKILKSRFYYDPRIKVIFPKQKRQGISATTNLAIAHASGDYVIFLDHDDRLALDAIDQIQQCITEAQWDIIYSDRDMLNQHNVRFMHLMKPDWSPETLLSGNYIFHLMCYRREFGEQIGWLRSKFDGSQDYDLVLRASEYQPKVKHIPRVLYHWRQHQASVSLNEQAKDYAFEAGVKALQEAVKRRNLNALAKEDQQMYRGNYQLDFKPLAAEQLLIINMDLQQPYLKQIREAIETAPSCQYYAIVAKELDPENAQTLYKMAAWLQIQQLVMVSGKIINEQRIVYAGGSYHANGRLLFHYQNYPVSEWGYMGTTHTSHNISVPHPYCVILRADAWKRYHDFVDDSSLALLDFALAQLELGERIFFQAESRFFLADQNQAISRPYPDLTSRFWQRWQSRLAAGDPHYGNNLCDDCMDMRLRIEHTF